MLLKSSSFWLVSSQDLPSESFEGHRKENIICIGDKAKPYFEIRIKKLIHKTLSKHRIIKYEEQPSGGQGLSSMLKSSIAISPL